MGEGKLFQNENLSERNKLRTTVRRQVYDLKLIRKKQPEGEDWIHLAHERHNWQTSENTALELFSIKVR